VPLKELDLKTTDTYKKASRLDLPKLAAGKAKFFIYKDVELPNASGKKQKYPAFLALVDDKGIRKALAGKKLLCKGLCSMKQERISFEPSTGTVPYKVLKVSVPLLLGKTLLIPNGMEEADSEEDDVEAKGGKPAPPAPPRPRVPPPPPPPPPRPPRAGVAPSAPPKGPGAPQVTVGSLTGAWVKLVRDARVYLTSHPERKADLVRNMNAIGALLKAKKAAEARLRMNQLQTALRPRPAVGLGGSRAVVTKPGVTKPGVTKPGVTKPGAAKPADAAAQGAQVVARWNALVTDLQAGALAHPAKKGALFGTAAGVKELLRARKFDVASKLMDRLDAMLDENPKEKEYRTRYRALEGPLAAALKDPARDASGLRAANAFILEKAQAGDFDSALKAIARLGQSLAGRPAAKVRAEEAGV
jgi:hypothetical protein